MTIYFYLYPINTISTSMLVFWFVFLSRWVWYFISNMILVVVDFLALFTESVYIFQRVATGVMCFPSSPSSETSIFFGIWGQWVVGGEVCDV